jgi:Ca-activated chloride channel family protein
VSVSHPAWLVAAAATPWLLFGIWRWFDARQTAALERFVSAAMRPQLTRSVSHAKRRVQRALFGGALVALCVALAGPLVGFRWQELGSRGNEILFAIDTSRSMLAPDVKPDRLTRAKLGVDDLARRLDNDALGLVAFAGGAFLVNPITLDHAAFHASLAALDTHTIPHGGTNITSAIQVAALALRGHAGGDRILILVTDGEDLEGDAVAAAQAAHAAGLTIYTVGVGTPAGELIPLPEGGFVKDEAGALVRSRLDESELAKIAAAAGGFYVPLGARDEGLEKIYENVLLPLHKHELRSRQEKIYLDRYQWPLGLALVLLLTSLSLGTRRRGLVPAPAAVVARAARRVAVALAAAAWLSLATMPGASLRAADAAAGTDAHGASTKDHRKPLVEFNSGTAAYRAGQFPAAAQAFQQSITQAPSSAAQRLRQQEDAYYNLGNTLYRAGQATQKSAPDQTLKQWNDAVRAYETALQLRPDDADSKFNRDFVKRKIAELQPPPPPKNNSGSGPPPPASTPPPSPSPSPSPPPPPPGGSGSGTSPPPPPGTAEMTPEEARELLDSEKGEEHPPMGAPVAARSADQPPPKPEKNW